MIGQRRYLLSLFCGTMAGQQDLTETFLPGQEHEEEEEESSRWCWKGTTDKSSNAVPDDEEEEAARSTIETPNKTVDLKNDLWIDVPVVLKYPLKEEAGRRPTKVRLETMPQWQLTLAAVVLAAGIFIPQAIIKIAVITDDDFVSVGVTIHSHPQMLYT
jgi:hypothetical protein